MAFFRIRGNSISLLHGQRDEARGVRHRRLRTFKGASELRAHLEPESWARLRLAVEQEHPELALDWESLRRQAEELLCGQPGSAPPFEQRRKALRRALHKLERVLPEDDRRLARAVGPLLRRIVNRAYRLYGSIAWEESMERVGTLLPGDEETEGLVDQGLACYADGNAARGRRLFEQARRIDPCDPDLDNSEGLALFQRGKLADAERLFQSARSLAYDQLPDPHRAYSWSVLEARPYLRATYNLGLVKERQGQLQEALALFQECLERCPNDGIGARFHLGPIHQRLGNLHQALDCYQAHARGNLVDLPDPFYDQASALVGLGRLGEALDRLLEGMAINPHIPALLLKKRPSRPSGHHAAVDSPEWARSYAYEHHDLWSEKSRELLRRIHSDREVRARLRGLEELEDELRKASPTHRREVLERLDRYRRPLFPEALVARLKAELIAVPV